MGLSALVSKLRTPRTVLLLVTILLGLGVSLDARMQADASADLVVGIAEWRQEGAQAIEVQDRTYQRLAEALRPQELRSVLLIKIPTSLQNAQEVDTVADRFGVDVIVWGWYDEVAVRGYVDLAHATRDDGMTNDLQVFLERGGSVESIRVLKTLSAFDYYEDGVSFCVPRWKP